MSDQEQKNIELVKKGYEAFSAGDGDTMMSLFDDNIEWVQPGESTISGNYHGKAELGEHLSRLAAKSVTVKLNRSRRGSRTACPARGDAAGNRVGPPSRLRRRADSPEGT